MKSNKQRFQNRAVVGKEWEHKVAQALRDRGIDAVVVSEEATFDKPREHYTKNDVDILVNPDSDRPTVIEVKSRRDTCTFTGPADFPFPTVFVDTLQGWQGKATKPDYYLFVSQNTGCILALPTTDRRRWKVKKIFDRGYGYPTKTIIAPAEELKSLDWLVERLGGSDEEG